ncbi:trihelix transcription factor GT-3b isoform X1 [Cucumis melo]|uniref:Trihelix transcription factor GT-3b isoform X1 n=1 Tax=Cucumis melo TaxID=3656 RepID=A0A1S3CKZ2_CUCME|nr:trihelix transcription factor GT-3b isoform X1 [Cucumis melo]XP_008464202.1 trihelix transcription factor GT-3b isoform X1 [Cucumis melo]XP_050944158.1 trihelix transcription factor GT-3b isoform X1 [Cucumis melo]XP_050944159.1 trihelix transcription factor GT-3b isoform X1 [Cucumis melo]XP_050944160.1 trihelix transcription factor GT-3b isoform X1 [Cucumis melo]
MEDFCDLRRAVRLHRIAGVNADQAAGDRFPPWSVLETKELLAIRAALDKNFSEMKQNRMLWISVAGKMKAKGFNRSDEQCKCKWKNLVTRYKSLHIQGCETMDPKALKHQFPFYDDLHTIFTARMQKNWWVEAENRSGVLKRKANEDPNGDRELENEEKTKTKNVTKKRKWKRDNDLEEHERNLEEILKGFLKREMEMEREWREAFRVREEERRLKEEEWRMKMEGIEREKMTMEILWRENEEKRREREEARAQKTDALISALLTNLT